MATSSEADLVAEDTGHRLRLTLECGEREEDGAAAEDPTLPFDINQDSIREMMSEKGKTFTLPEGIPSMTDDAFSYREMLKKDVAGEGGLVSQEALERIYALSINDEGGDGDDSDDSDSEYIPFASLKKKMVPVLADNGVMKLVVQEGHGDIVPNGAFVFIKYSAYYEGQDEPYDSSYLRNEVRKFRLGTGAVLPGIDFAVRTMRLEEHAKFLIQPPYMYQCLTRFASGSHDSRIKIDEPALFKMELCDYIANQTAAEVAAMTRVERQNAKFSLVHKAAEEEKVSGSRSFKHGDYIKAVKRYKRAMMFMDDVHLKSDEDEEKHKDLSVLLHLNLALCYLRLDRAKLSRQEAQSALELAPQNPKALYRLGQAYMAERNYPKSRECLLKAKELRPYCKDTADALQRLELEEKQHMKEEKRFCSRIFKPEKACPISIDEEENVGARDLKQVIDENPDFAGISQEFMQLVSQQLSDFIGEKEMKELPLPPRFNDCQVAFVAQAAISLGLKVKFFKVPDSNMHKLKIVKP